MIKHLCRHSSETKGQKSRKVDCRKIHLRVESDAKGLGRPGASIVEVRNRTLRNLELAKTIVC